MYTFVAVLLATLFAIAPSQSTNIYPSIVQLVAEGSPNQVFKNTAGSNNLFYVAAVSANEGRDGEENWISNNRVFTVLSFEGIPPFATTCELRVEIPPDNLLWQVAIATNGQVLSGYNPTMLPTTPPQIVNGENEPFNGVFWTPNMIELVYPAFPCPGPSGPSGGQVGYVFAMNEDIPYSTASVFLAQDYSDPSSLTGVYLRYSTT